MRRLTPALVALLLTAACNPLRPTCGGQSGHAGSLAGTVAAGSTTGFRLTYDTRGSQNDLDIAWTDQGANGARLQFFATRVECQDFSLSTPTVSCQVVGRAGWHEDGATVTTLIITHGRGNPEQLGAPAEYKLWVVGDPDRAASFSIGVTWRRPVDC